MYSSGNREWWALENSSSTFKFPNFNKKIWKFCFLFSFSSKLSLVFLLILVSTYLDRVNVVRDDDELRLLLLNQAGDRVDATSNN